MKVFFEKHDLIIKSESYEENIALETWSENFFKRVDLNIDTDKGFYLLITHYSKEQEYKHDLSKA
jgi:hypothetical protein